VDRLVYDNHFEQFSTDEKRIMLHLLEKEVKIANNKQVFTNAIKIYVRSVFDALCDNNPEEILFYKI
jgi:hypothetical protein